MGPLLAHVPVWLLVLFRLSGLFMMGPMFGSQAIPPRVKVFLALGLSFCVYPLLLTPGSPSASSMGAFMTHDLSLWTLLAAVAMELTIGLVLGFGMTCSVAAMQLGGRLIDQQMGLGVASVFNPDLGSEAGIVSEIFFLLALTLFLIMGGHVVLVTTLVGSFGHIPLGGFVPDGHLLDLALGLLTSMLELAIRVAAPLLVLIFLETVAMGFIARTVPQMNILSIGFAVRILMGAVLLIGGIGITASVYQGSLIQTMEQLRRFVSP